MDMKNIARAAAVHWIEKQKTFSQASAAATDPSADAARTGDRREESAHGGGEQVSGVQS